MKCPLCGYSVVRWLGDKDSSQEYKLADHLVAHHGRRLGSDEFSFFCVCGAKFYLIDDMANHLREQGDVELHFARAILSR